MPNKSFVEDMVTLAGGVFNNLAESRHELKAQMRARASNLARDFDLVTRDEFDAAFGMLAKARQLQEDLADRLAQIEARLGMAKSGLSSTKKYVKTKKSNLPSVKTKKADGRQKRADKRR